MRLDNDFFRSSIFSIKTTRVRVCMEEELSANGVIGAAKAVVRTLFS
jgi:hypothetical protein